MRPRFPPEFSRSGQRSVRLVSWSLAALSERSAPTATVVETGKVRKGAEGTARAPSIRRSPAGATPGNARAARHECLHRPSATCRDALMARPAAGEQRAGAEFADHRAFECPSDSRQFRKHRKTPFSTGRSALPSADLCCYRVPPTATYRMQLKAPQPVAQGHAVGACFARYR